MTHQSSRDAAADLIENYWSGSDAEMMKLAKSYRAGHDHGTFLRAFESHRATVTAELVERLTGVDGLARVISEYHESHPDDSFSPWLYAQAIAAHIRAVAEEG